MSIESVTSKAKKLLSTKEGAVALLGKLGSVTIDVVRLVRNEVPTHVSYESVLGVMCASAITKDVPLISVEANIPKAVKFLSSAPAATQLQYRTLYATVVNTLMENSIEDLPDVIRSDRNGEEATTVRELNDKAGGKVFIADTEISKYMEDMMTSEEGSTPTLLMTLYPYPSVISEKATDSPSVNVFLLSSKEQERRSALFQKGFDNHDISRAPLSIMASSLIAAQLFGGFEDDEFYDRLKERAFFSEIAAGVITLAAVTTLTKILDTKFVDMAKDFF